MSVRSPAIVGTLFLLLGASAALAEPGDELVGDWERTVGAKKAREVWHVERSGQRLTLSGKYFQGEKEVGKFRGEGEKYDEAAKMLRCKMVIDLAGQPARQDGADYELSIKGTRLAVTLTLGKRKETLNLTKAKVSAATATSDLDKPFSSAASSSSTENNPPGDNPPANNTAGNSSATRGAPQNFQPPENLPGFTEVRRFQLGPFGFLFEVALSPDGKTLALSDIGQDGKAVALYDVDSGKVVQRLPAEGTVSHMAFTDDGTMFVSAAFNLGKPGPVIGWDTSTWTEKWRLSEDSIMSRHALSGDGRWYAASRGNEPGGPGGVLKIWNTVTKELVHSQESSSAARLAWPADGRVLLVSEGNEPKILDRQTRKFLPPPNPKGRDDGVQGEIYGIAVTPDGRGYAMGDVYGGSAVLVTTSGKLVKSFPRLNQGVGMAVDVAFIDNRKLLVAHRACEFALFDVTTGKALAYTRDKNAGKRPTTDIDYRPGCPRFAAYCGPEAIVFELPK